MAKSRQRKKKKVISLRKLNNSEEKYLKNALKKIGQRTKKGQLTAEATRQQKEYHSSITILKRLRSKAFAPTSY